jgi:hypothetical protein
VHSVSNNALDFSVNGGISSTNLDRVIVNSGFSSICIGKNYLTKNALNSDYCYKHRFKRLIRVGQIWKGASGFLIPMQKRQEGF